MLNIPRVAQYARFSSDNQRSESIDAQLRAMNQFCKKRYLTRGVNETIPFEIQLFLWEAVDNMPNPKDYLQVFNLSIENGLQVVRHTSEQPEFEMTYILTTVSNAVTAKIYIIDDGEQCTMLLAEEY